jgi:hypothetical protein
LDIKVDAYLLSDPGGEPEQEGIDKQHEQTYGEYDETTGYGFDNQPDVCV